MNNEKLKNEKAKKLFAVFSSKKYLIPVILVLLALCLIIFSSGDKREETAARSEAGLLSEKLEERIRLMCEKVEGVGNVYVMLTLDTSEEYVYAADTEKNGSTVKSEFVLADSSSGIELYVVCPKVRGVAVVCDGGDRATVKKVLSELISSALGIPISKISIAGT